MSTQTGHLEEKEFLVKEFIWVDNGFSCSSGTLLSILHRLSNNESVTILDDNILLYLNNKGLIIQVESGKYITAEGKAEACVTLGNNVSGAIGKRLSKLKPEEIEYITKQ